MSLQSNENACGPSKEDQDQHLLNTEQEDPKSTYYEQPLFQSAMRELFGIGPKPKYGNMSKELLEDCTLGARQWLIIFHCTFTAYDDYTIQSYPAPSKQWILHVLRKFRFEKLDDHTEALVVNRRRSLQYDIQASDWEDGRKQLLQCLHQYVRSNGRRSYSPPVSYGIVAIGGYAKFYEYHLKDRSMIPSIPGDPALHIGLKCSTIQNFLNQIKANN
ncbi:hypothetical protein Egran_06562 [Elaphomyces granulatus]|uniref:Uncharacterized protein n=1 Tax=Elaphomyces granulatus TaxID=519963 RepID=A0A232LNC5_9EURO|nr:hypothetical protein Egran_06562 [Elaphomyces granulatus]